LAGVEGVYGSHDQSRIDAGCNEHNKMNQIAKTFLFVSVLLLAACASAPKRYDYAHFRTEAPHSILVVPVTNKSVDVNAPDYFLATIATPLAERGYYVFPVNMVKSVLSDDGLSDANLVHAGDPHRLGELFGADAIMYISIERWDARYAVLSTAVTVELTYTLKSAHTGLRQTAVASQACSPMRLSPPWPRQHPITCR